MSELDRQREAIFNFPWLAPSFAVMHFTSRTPYVDSAIAYYIGFRD
jgi:hypothetical protein